MFIVSDIYTIIGHQEKTGNECRLCLFRIWFQSSGKSSLYNDTPKVQSRRTCLAKFLKAFEKYELDQVSEKNIENYITHLLQSEKISDTYQKQVLGTIAKFYELTYDKKLRIIYRFEKSL